MPLELSSVPQPLVYILTLNWNGCSDTLKLIQSCMALTYPNARLIVIDNASTDASVVTIKRQFPAVKQLLNQQNLGFAAGMNVGIQYALAHHADFIFLVNNDTTLHPDSLTYLIAGAAQSGAYVAAPAIYYMDNPNHIWSAGALRRKITLEIKPCILGSNVTELFNVDAVTGCGMLLRRECLQAIGLFDERFFMYYEDMDYCLRVRARGLAIVVVPAATMWHKVAMSSGGSGSPNERYHMAKSSVQFFRKHTHGWRWWVVAPYRTASAVKTVLRLGRQRRWAAARAYLLGLYAGLTH
ncbi:MAG: glycosyltransferase family 2 protein [Herpetosiphonaceae bacterium]|nr:glycosyltransferase family 2 protein [Herpetosiphonaceae bacterium]